MLCCVVNTRVCGGADKQQFDRDSFAPALIASWVVSDQASQSAVFQEYMVPMVRVLRREARPLGIAELDELVGREMGLSEEELAVPHKESRPDQSEASYRMGWARSYLKKTGWVSNPRRGLWAAVGDRPLEQLDPEAVAQTVRETHRSGPSDEVAPEPDADLELEEHDNARVGAKLALALQRAFSEATRAGHVPSRKLADGQRARFRDRFGPEALSRLDGEALLLHMHARGNHDSLVYWLEFKDDEEFGGWFGSIAGGSALKFGLYQSAESQDWVTGSPQRQTILSSEQAIDVARNQRDQLVVACRVASEVSREAEPDFDDLQARLDELAPLVCDSAWGHKYLSVLYPALVSAFHSVPYQQYQLIKLVKRPTHKRYENARFFYYIARQVGLTMTELSITLRQLFGAPRACWRVGTLTDQGSYWPQMREGGYMAVHWPLGDLSWLDDNAGSKEQLADRLRQALPNRPPQLVAREVNELVMFLVTAQTGDTVIAMQGQKVLGIGRIEGDYHFVPDASFVHRRPVKWLSTHEWQQPEREALRTTFRPIKRLENLLQIEARLLGVEAPLGALPTTKPTAEAGPLAPLAGIYQRIDSALNRKGQVILYGPPGTGKTYSAQGAAKEIAARSWFGVAAGGLSDEQSAELEQGQAISLISFHPGYGYEDFIEGYRPQLAEGGVAFALRDGLLKRLAKQAAQQPRRKFVLIIDEINRGDVPRIFGELLTILEKDKRGAGVLLPLSGERFLLPDNVLLIGTMNTADRSIALLDAALRRRFGFIELMPDHSLLGDASVAGLPLGEWLRRLNERVVTELGRDTRNLQVGHSYLLHDGRAISSVARFADALRDEIIPLLQEYCYEDYAALQSLLGKDLVDSQLQLIREEVLAVGQHDRLIQSLLSAFDGITTSASAVRADALAQEPDGEVDGDDETEQGDP